MARTSTRPRPARGPQRRRHGDDPGPRARCPGGGRQPRSGRPGRAVGRTRRGDRRGDRRPRRDQHRRRPAGPARAREGRHRDPGQGQPARHRRHLDARRRPAAPGDEAPPAEAPGTGSTTGDGQPAAEPAGSTADAGQPAPAPADGTAEGQQAEAGTEPGPDPAVTAEAAGTVAAIAQAADEAGKALAAGNLDVALAALETARDLAAQGRRVVKAAASGRRAPATRPGALRDLVEEHLRKFPDAAFTPHQVGKVLTRSAGAVANALDKLVSLGTAQMVTDKPRTYRLAPARPGSAPDAAGDPGTSAETAASAA